MSELRVCKWIWVGSKILKCVNIRGSHLSHLFYWKTICLSSSMLKDLCKLRCVGSNLIVLGQNWPKRFYWKVFLLKCRKTCGSRSGLGQIWSLRVENWSQRFYWKRIFTNLKDLCKPRCVGSRSSIRWPPPNEGEIGERVSVPKFISVFKKKIY